MTYEQMLERVQYDGVYPTRERAEEVVRDVLGVLAGQLTGADRAALAARLPEEAARGLGVGIPSDEALTGWRFVREVAARTGTAPAMARWDVGAVLPTVARLAGEDLVARIVARLPAGYAQLFGRPELQRSAAA